jgi:hypothetical protein
MQINAWPWLVRNVQLGVVSLAIDSSLTFLDIYFMICLSSIDQRARTTRGAPPGEALVLNPYPRTDPADLTVTADPHTGSDPSTAQALYVEQSGELRGAPTALRWRCPRRPRCFR